MATKSESTTPEELSDRLTEFVNSWPLYSPFALRFAEPRASAPDLPLTILRDCPRCAATPTWYRRHPFQDSSNSTQYVGGGWVIAYRCTHCRAEELRIWYFASESRVKNPDGSYGGIVAVTLRKFGQWPAQRIEPSREVTKELDEPVLDMFKKGLTSLTHGFGLGALAYFRRVVEDASAKLIDFFADKAAAEGDTDSERAIRAAQQSHRMEDRLRLAAEALPATLRPGGVNPLAVLYAQYSRGIHGLSDEECLEVAKELHFVLEYIFKNWRLQMEDAAKFSAVVQHWSSTNKTPADKS